MAVIAKMDLSSEIYSYKYKALSVYIRAKFQENEITFGPDFFGSGFHCP